MNQFMVTVLIADAGTAKEVLEKVQAALDAAKIGGSAASCERDDFKAPDDIENEAKWFEA